MNARCAMSVDERNAEMAWAIGYLSTLHPDGSVACSDPMRIARWIYERIEAERTAAALSRKSLAKYKPRTVGAARTIPIQCDHIHNADVLAGYEVDEDGVVALTHLWVNGGDIYQLVESLPEVLKQIEDRIKAAEDAFQEDV